MGQIYGSRSFGGFYTHRVLLYSRKGWKPVRAGGEALAAAELRVLGSPSRPRSPFGGWDGPPEHPTWQGTPFPARSMPAGPEWRDLVTGGLRGSASAVSHRWPGHEQQVGALARELGFRQVSLSSEVMPMVRLVPRGYTACVDAYLTPCILRYLHSFRDGFASQLQVRRRSRSKGQAGGGLA